MARSRKSNSAFIFDLPSVTQAKGSFEYNFFTKDESIDDIDEVAKTRSFLESPNPSSRPRYNLVKFDAPQIPQWDPEILGSAPWALLSMIRRNFSLSQLEPGIEHLDAASLAKSAQNDLQLIPTSKFSDLTFQDSNIDSKLLTLVQKAVNRMIIAENKKVSSEIDQERADFLSRRIGSQNDYGRILRREFQNVNEDFLLNALNQTDTLNEAFIDETEKEEITQNIFNDIKSLTLNARINDKLLDSTIGTVVNEGISLFSEELISIQDRAKEIAEAGSSSAAFGTDAMYFTPIDLYLGADVPVNSNQITLDLVGYVIDKFQDLSDGNVSPKQSLFVNSDRSRIEGSRSFGVRDYDIVYGSSYTYAVRAIYLMSVPTKNGDQTSNGFFLVSSKSSNVVHIKTHEMVPPEPPTDFIVTFDNKKQKPLLMWSFPFNRQRDIKRFQVMRRKTINDPFELIREIDFDDSIVKYDTPEFVSPHLKRTFKSPVTFFIDEKFERDQSYIYTLRSVDAHGQMSGYAEQIHARYDRFTNKLITRLISIRGTRSGCPVQYPNFYIDEKVLHETAKNSHHSRVKLYLDPEYLKVLASDPDDPQRTKDLHFLPFSGGEGEELMSRFKLQILNTDLQQSKIVDIFIKDNRISENN